MENLKVFNHPEFGEVEVLIINGKEHFGATKVAITLGYTNPHKAIKDHCKKEGVNETLVPTSGGNQLKKFITEGNLYRLITKSKLPSAEKFESWLFDEVLPTIRKHGAYMTEDTIEKALTNPDFLIQLATNLKEEKQARKIAETKLEKQQPLVSFAETCMRSDTGLLVREVAKLCSKNGLTIGEKRLWQKLRDWGLVFKKKNEPMQEYVDRGYFEVSQGVKETSKGALTWVTMRVTPKGQTYIVNRLKKELVVA